MLSQLSPRRSAVLLAVVSAIVLMAAHPAAAAESEDRWGLAKPDCANNKKDGLESGVDCGGLHCPACGPGKQCLTNKDCQSGQCLGNLCTFGTTCTNNIRDNDESDVDCGGINSGCLACCWSQECKVDTDCQSRSCQDGRCAEAKYCAGRFFYDELGENIQLKTFDGKTVVLPAHQQPIKCGQCVCQDCPVSTIYFTFTLAGLCNSTVNEELVAQITAQINAEAKPTDFKIFCADTAISVVATTTGRKLLQTNAVYTGSICTANEGYQLPLGTKNAVTKAGCFPLLPAAAPPPPSPPA